MTEEKSWVKDKITEVYSDSGEYIYVSQKYLLISTDRNDLITSLNIV